MYFVCMSTQHHLQEARRPPKLLASAVTLLAGTTLVAHYLPQLGVMPGHWQKEVSSLCARTAGCGDATHRTEAAPDRASLLSVVTVGTTQRWRSGDIERFKAELRRLLPDRQVELRLRSPRERAADGGDQ